MFGGGGPLVVGRHDRPGRFEDGTSPILKGHSGAVLDTDWSPFDDSLLATGSEDSTIKLWSIPDDWEPTDDKGLGKKGSDFSESLLELDGHAKKVTLLRFHPTASNTLLSTAADYTVKVWDVETGQAVSTFEQISDLSQDIVWDVRGDSYATSNKDKTLRIIDGRTGKESVKVDKVHEGVKSVKIQWLGESGKLLTTGASKTSGREMKVWDIKNLGAGPLQVEAVDNASGALMPLFDQDTGVLYLCGKGDGQIRLYEYEDKEPYIFKLTDGFRSTTPGKGYCTVPKRGLDIMSCETMRILKLTNKDGIHPLRFTVPRKSDAFQDDIFPPAPAPTPAHSCSEWMKGSSKVPITMKLDPESMSSNGSSSPPKKNNLKTVPMLTKECSKMKRHIQTLEKKLHDAGIGFDAFKFED